MKAALMSSPDSFPRSLSEQLALQADRQPDHPYVGVGDDILTFSQLRTRSDAVAAGLALLNVDKGSRVALIMKNRVEFIVAFFAIVRLGAIVVPVNIYLKGSFLTQQLRDVDAAIVIADRAGATAVAALRSDLPSLAHVFIVDPAGEDDSDSKSFASLSENGTSIPDIAIGPADIAAILYTSGTTGLPKGCMLSHGYYLNSPRQFFESGLLVAGDRIATPYPLYHASGNLITLMAALYGGLELIYMPEFSASKFMAQAADAGATVVWGIGAMGAAILASPEQPGEGERPFRLAMWIPMDAAAQARFEARFATPVIAEMYGQTEFSPVTLSPLDSTRVRGSLGLPVSSIELRLVDADDREVPLGETGEIIIRPRESNTMFSGYWRRPQETVDTFRNLWHHTGDTARMDDRGYLHFMDRKRDAIRRRGVNISSVQLEQALIAHPGIANVAVHAVPSPLGESDIKVCIVCAPTTTFTAEGLFDFFRQTLPYYAVPRFVELVESLPVNALGRIMKHELRARAAQFTWDFETLGLVISKADRRG